MKQASHGDPLKAHNLPAAVLDIAGVLVVVLDVEGRIVQFNRLCQELSGYSLDEAVGQPLWELMVPQEHRQWAAAIHQQVVAGEPPGPGESPWVAKAGTLHTVNWRVSVLNDANGNVEYVILAGTDVTDFHRSRRALQASEERFRGVVDNIGIGVTVLDRDMRVLTANRQMRQWYVGLEPDQHPVCYEVFNNPPRETPCQYCPVVTAFEDGMSHSAVTDTPVGDAVVHYKIIATPLLDENGNVTAVIETVEDVTSQQRRERALRESEQRFRDVATNSADFIWEVDATGRYTYCSGRVQEILGYEPAEMLGMTPFELMSPEDAERVLNVFESVAKRQSPVVELENWNVTKDGRRVCLLTNGVPRYNERGEFAGYRGTDRDITERKRVDDELRSSEAKFRALYDSTSDAVMLLDEKGFFDCNEATLAIFSCATREEFCSKHPADLSPPQQPCGTDSMTLANQRIATAMAEGGHRFDWMHKRDNTGEVFPAEVLLSAMELDGRQVIQAVVRDITRRKQAEDERERLVGELQAEVGVREHREAQLRGLQAISPRLAGATELGEVLDQVVQSARSLVGAELAVIALLDPATGGIGAAYHANFPEERIPPGTQIMGQGLLGMLMRGQEVFSGDVTAHAGFVALPPWHPPIASCIGVPLMAQGQVTALLLVGDPAADRFTEDDRLLVHALADLAGATIENSNLMAQLREANLLQDAILDTAATAVMVLDPERRITSINSAFTQITGHAEQDVLGKSCLVLEGAPCQQVCGLFEQGKERVNGAQCTVQHKDGKTLSIRKNAQMMRDAKGEITGAIESFVDVTDLVNAQQAALQASEAKSGFLARMSHEIRTPMNGVIGMLALAMDTPLTDEQREFLSTAGTSAEALLALLNDILDFSKIEAGQLKLEQRVFDLGTVLENAVAVVAAEASHKGLELPVFVDPRLPQFVVGDSHRLRQVIVNLLSNAVKFTEVGEVEARAELDVLDGFALRVRISVRDTGIGIAPEAQARVFDVFEQADGSTTRKHGGSGLGLAICRQLVEMMGGALSLRSVAGKGSEFSFNLPLEVARAEDAPQPVSVEELRGMPVLIVDDNATNRRILMEYLKSWGCKPRQAANASEALDRLRVAAEDKPFGLAIVDGQMPGLNGFDLTRVMRSDPRLKKTTVLMLSSLGPGVAHEALDAGAAGYVLKPIKRSDLFDAIAVALGYHEKEADQPAADKAPAPDRTLRVLVAEDNPVNQKVAVRTLNRAGHAAQTVATGLQAIEALRAGPFDLVLMDVQMPEMDGLEATRRLRQEPCFADLPIIALTAHALEGDRERCLKAGMNDYLSKPFTADLLLAVLSKWTNGRKEAGEREMPASAPDANADAGTGAATAPLDMAVLVQAIGEDDEDFALSLVADLVQSGQDLVETMGAATQSEDADALRRAAHSLKGSAAMMGAEDLRDAAAHLEQCGQDDDLVAANEALPAVQREFARLREWAQQAPQALASQAGLEVS